jgi:hypothetical protein
MSPFSRDSVHQISLAATMVVLATVATGQERDRPKADPTERITLQYRVARDAFAPSKFVALIDGGMSIPLELIWDLPVPAAKDEGLAQERQKTEFDALIKHLEAKQINGVEFDCRGEWVQKGTRLRITTVPQPTETGKRKIRDGGG